jgi:repressor LexA
MLPLLTARQKEIYDFLLKTIREKGYAPSIPEIGRQFKIASTNGVADHLKALEKKGISAESASGPSRFYPHSVSLF